MVNKEARKHQSFGGTGRQEVWGAVSALSWKSFVRGAGMLNFHCAPHERRRAVWGPPGVEEGRRFLLSDREAFSGEDK